MYRLKHLAFICLLSVITFALAGCEDDDEFDHNPPAGQGSLIISNRTYDDIFVYIDGVEVLRTPYRSWRAYDIAPGVHRVVLDQRDGDAYYDDEVDILERKVTVWKVVLDYYDFYVRKWVD